MKQTILFFIIMVFNWGFGNEKWESTQLIWNFGLINSCDVGTPKNPSNYFKDDPVFDLNLYNHVQSGDILWIQPHLVLEFYEKALPLIQAPFVMVVSDGDASFPSDCLNSSQVESLLTNEYLIHLFAQNYDYRGTSQKISPIPIGIDFHTVAYKGGKQGGWGMIGSPKQQETYLLHNLQEAPPTYQRKCKAFVDFQHSDTMHASFRRYLQCGEDRSSIFRLLLVSRVIDYGKWMNRKELWNTKKEYAFSISPHGNGLDCHRTWEDLALGCIVIVKSSPLNPLYEGLPVVIINDWTEINEENFHKWIVTYGDASYNPSYREKLTNRYWMNKIIKKANPYKVYE